MHLNCAIAYYSADSIPSNKQFAETHFNLAKLSTENLVIENRSKKEKDLLELSLEMPHNYISPSKVILKPVYNYAYKFDNKYDI